MYGEVNTPEKQTSSLQEKLTATDRKTYSLTPPGTAALTGTGTETETETETEAETEAETEVMTETKTWTHPTEETQKAIQTEARKDLQKYEEVLFSVYSKTHHPKDTETDGQRKSDLS